MTEASLHQYLAERADDPAVRLLAQTAAALRADPGFIRRRDDLAAAAFLDDETPAAMDADALDHVLARIERQAELDRSAEARGPERGEIARLPSPLREAALAALDARGWSFGGPGIRRLALVAGRGCQAELMRIAPGRGAALHDHDGDEVTLVLAGGFSDERGHYAPGDISLARPGFRHLPVADPDVVCYVLGVTYGPPRFFGLLGFLQRALGFPWSPVAPRAA